MKDYFPDITKDLNLAITHGHSLFVKYGLNDDKRIHMFMAQMAHESAGFTRLTERAYKNITFEEKYGHTTRVGQILGNNNPGDGGKYFGRGIIQLTGKWNYNYYGARIGEDLIDEPELASKPYIALKLALEYWKRRKLNTAADDMDVRRATKLINGRYNGLKDRQMIYDRLDGVKYTDLVTVRAAK